MGSSSIPTTITLWSCASSTFAEAADRGLAFGGGSDFATAPAVDHRLRQPGFALESAAIMRASGLDDLAVAAENIVAELEDPQIGPGPRAQAGDLAQQLVSRPLRACLCHNQGRRRGRAGYPCVAVNKEMRVLRGGEIAREREEQLDIPALGCDPSRLRLDYVMK